MQKRDLPRSRVDAAAPSDTELFRSVVTNPIKVRLLEWAPLAASSDASV